MASLYANENFPLPVVEKLRELGHDVLTIQETGKSDQALPDAEVLAFARREGRAVLTLNRLHFIRLHRQQTDHAGIIVCKVDSDFDGQGERIDKAIASSVPLTGKLLRVNRG
jgi:predicted nuclease of predicted toxin-antitoxin system